MNILLNILNNFNNEYFGKILFCVVLVCPIIHLISLVDLLSMTIYIYNFKLTSYVMSVC